MLISARIPRHKLMSLLFTISLILLFLLLLSNIETVNISRIIEGRESGVKNPGVYVKYVHPIPSNISYCKLNYGLPAKLNYEFFDLSGSPELGKDSPFYVLYNVIEGSIAGNAPGVTYATHITKDFVVFLTEVVRYWEGPVSVAAYLPDGNPRVILDQILNFCYCVPEMSKLSLHFVFRNNLQPKYLYQSNIVLPPGSCDIEELAKVDSSNTLTESDDDFNTVRPNRSDNDWYPINVCRNAARYAAYTDFIMVCDVELLPSQGLASRFIDMTESYKCQDPEQCSKTVYVVPIFEVEATEDVPRTKTQLINLMNQEKAVYFHRIICGHCQKFPGLEKWKETEPGDLIKPLLETKREAPYDRWEPIYIGTKLEPMYPEKLSWEGFQDKMLQMLEMCLAGYKLVILDGAFLVHWPGIKTTKLKDIEPWRKPFIKKNQKHYNVLLRNITTRYRANIHCKIK